MDHPEPAVVPDVADVLESFVFEDLLASLVQPAAVAAVYRKFVANAAGFIAELPAQAPDARIDTLHTLKGSAAMMGAKRLSRVAAELQAQAERSSVQVEQAMIRLEAELAKFRSVAAAQLRTLGVSLEA